jgi:hypothetical protein
MLSSLDAISSLNNLPTNDTECEDWKEHVLRALVQRQFTALPWRQRSRGLPHMHRWRAVIRARFTVVEAPVTNNKFRKNWKGSDDGVD